MLLRLGREAGDEVRPQRRFRTQSAGAGGKLQEIGTGVTTLHALQDQIMPMLRREVQMRHQALLLGEDAPEGVIQRGGVQG